MSWTHEYLLYDPDAGNRTELTGLVTDFQRFSIHDGPGIRTIVFLKGCPLHCAWCANPEAISPRPEIMLIPHNCIRCGKCIEACPSNCFGESDGLVCSIDRDRCLLPECGKCQMKKYVCDVCGYIYDPAEGDPDNGVEPGTAFEDLPDDWECPVCGASKEEFSKEE